MVVVITGAVFTENVSDAVLEIPHSFVTVNVIVYGVGDSGKLITPGFTALDVAGVPPGKLQA